MMQHTSAAYVDRSKIHGKGVFAWVDLKTKQFFHIPSYLTHKPGPRAAFTKDGKAYEFFSPFAFLNHSETPNAELWEDKGCFELKIIKPIKPGEEITIDYSG